MLPFINFARSNARIPIRTYNDSTATRTLDSLTKSHSNTGFNPFGNLITWDDMCDTDSSTGSIPIHPQNIKKEKIPEAVYASNLKRTLFFVAGGPGSGKTTLLNNFSQLINGTNDMVKIGSRLKYALDSKQPYLNNALNNKLPLLVDNHGINPEIILHIHNIIKNHKYRGILIHPFVDRETMEFRLYDRKIEIGREFDADNFWNKHLLFHRQLSKYICEDFKDTFFQDIIVYDNRTDDKHPIFIRHNNNNYIFDPQLINIILTNGKMASPYIIKKSDYEKEDKKTSDVPFVPKPEHFISPLEKLFRNLLSSLANPYSNYENYLNSIKKN